MRHGACAKPQTVRTVWQTNLHVRLKFLDPGIWNLESESKPGTVTNRKVRKAHTSIAISEVPFLDTLFVVLI